MEYRINNYNKEYIMLKKADITYEMCILQVSEENSTQENKKMEKLLRNIWNAATNYKTKSGRKPIITEIAINKESKLATLILSNTAKNKTNTITIDQIIHTLLISIEDQQWEYYNILSYLIMYYKQNNIDNINYEDFLKEHGKELINYIMNNSLRICNINNYHNDKNIYLYEDGKITQTELPEPTLSASKTKKRTIN